MGAEEVHNLFYDRWVPSGVILPEEGLTDEEVMATIIRITGGNFRLLHCSVLTSPPMTAMFSPGLVGSAFVNSDVEGDHA